MADDIVTSLRLSAEWIKDLEHESWFGTAELQITAADEIERLREIAEAADQYHDVACDPDWCRLCRALNAWREARRG